MRRRIKNRIIFVAVKWAVLLVGLMPRRWGRAMGRGVGAAAFVIAGTERRRACGQLRTAYGDRMTERRGRALTRGVFDRLGWSVTELCRMVRNPADRPGVELPESSREVLERTLAAGRGAVFVTAHLGNWELMAAALAERGFPIHTIAKRSYDPRFTKLIERARTAFGVRVLYRGDAGVAAGMLRVLRNNGVLGFLIDQDTDVPSVFAPFFGSPAKTPSGAAVFAHRFDAPLVVGTVSRRSADGVHVIDIESVPRRANVSQTVAALNRVLEMRIRRHPAEWVWFHRRWKSRPVPSGEAV